MSFQAVAQALAIQGISATDKFVLIALANYADHEGCCWPSQPTLAEDTCLSTRTIMRSLKALEEAGLIERERRTREDGSRASDSIHLRLSASRQEAKPKVTKRQGLPDSLSPSKVTKSQGGGDTKSGHEPIKEPISKILTPPPPFEAFWSAYPKKVGKFAAAKSLEKALERDTIDAILEGLERAKPNWTDPRYIPNPATWLNQGRWLDQPASITSWSELLAEEHA